MAENTSKNSPIAYDDIGSGLPIVLIHGHPFNRSMWQPQLEELRHNHRVINFDLRGYGESHSAPAVKDFSDFAFDILDLLDHLNISSFVVMGLSMGGQIALETWYQAQERVIALVLADTFSGLDSLENKQLRYDTAERVLQEGMKDYANELLPRMIASETLANKQTVAQHGYDMMCKTSPKGAAAALRSRAERQDYTPYLKEISIPAQIIVGAEDVFTPVEDAKFMHSKIRSANCDVIDKAGHLPNLEQPEKFNAILKAFLTSLT